MLLIIRILNFWVSGTSWDTLGYFHKNFDLVRAFEFCIMNRHIFTKSETFIIYMNYGSGQFCSICYREKAEERRHIELFFPCIVFFLHGPAYVPFIYLIHVYLTIKLFIIWWINWSVLLTLNDRRILSFYLKNL